MAKRTHAHGHDTKHFRVTHRNFCFACGKDNPHGMHLKFFLDDDGRHFVCRFRLSDRFWGPPKHAHGGIIATILDEAMGKVNKLRHVIAVTSKMTVEYLKPVPLGKPLVAVGWEKSVRGRRHINLAEVRNQAGEVLARSQGTFIAIDPHRMFGKYLTKAQQAALRKQSGVAPNGRRRARSTDEI
ncbi:MAG TPA: PaaI family thioesterase [Terriglobales bacterium]|nr:PaaI family thioesterase [Terriglobales bacterium]